jgi:hypothetical protein
VLPLDGGHILEDVLGPRRFKLTATLSLIGGIIAVVLCLYKREMWIAFIFGLCTAQTYQRFRALAGPSASPNPAVANLRRQADTDQPIAPAVLQRLRQAEQALADERYDEAGTQAELLLTETLPSKARVKALHIVGWAHLFENRADEAMRVLKTIRREGQADPLFVGTLLMQKGELVEARSVIEQARGDGDDRKELVGPLIQILIKQGEVARAAAIAFDIVESLSDEDARQMAAIAFEQAAYPWASRLSEAVFERSGEPDDAYDAARSRALEGDSTAALQLLRRAVAAGFSDAARAWSDKALEALRTSEDKSELEALLPRPAE